MNNTHVYLRKFQYQSAFITFRKDCIHELSRIGYPRYSVDNEHELARVCEKLDQVSDKCYWDSLVGISEYAPKKEYRRKVLTLLNEAVQSEYEAAKKALNDKADNLIQNEIQKESQEIVTGKKRLAKLVEQLEQDLFPGTNERYPRPSPSWRVGDVTPYWKGADIIVAAEPMPDYHGSKTVVITEHAKVLALLLHKLFDACTECLDHMSKYEFFGRIADSVNEGINGQDDVTERYVLQLAVGEAQNVLDTWLDRLHR